MKGRALGLLWLAFGAGQVQAQTAIDLSTQARNVDFSKAITTRPFKVGPAPPPVCATGELFFHTGSPAGQVIFACTATNVWTVQKGVDPADFTGTGLLTQTGQGQTVGRAIAAGVGVTVSNGDGVAGNPAIAADVASQSDAEASLSSSKLMTPERTRQAFEAWNPVPVQTGANMLLAGDGLGVNWTHKLTIPPSGIQTLTAPTSLIVPDRYTVQISAASTTTLVSTPTMSDGDDGQYVCVLNVGANNVTLQDEGQLAGSGLRLNTDSLTLGPNESVCFVFSAVADGWIRANKDVDSGAGLVNVSGPASSVDSRMAVFDGTTGKAIKEGPNETGVVKITSGVPSVIGGAAGDCITVDGGTSACGGKTHITQRVELPTVSVTANPTPYPASGWVIQSGGPGINGEATRSTGAFYFNDTTAGAALVYMSVPPGYDSSVPPAVHLTVSTSDMAGNTTATFNAQIACVRVDGTQLVNGAAPSVTSAYVPAGGTPFSIVNSGAGILTGRTHRVTADTFPGHGCQADELMWLKVWRDTSDTSAVALSLFRADVDFKVLLQ